MKKIRNIVVVLGVIGVSSIFGVSTAQASQPATTHTVYSCPTGGTLSGTSCVVDGAVTPAHQDSVSASVSYRTLWCAYGDPSRECNSEGIWGVPVSVPSYSCPNGGTLSGSNCLVDVAQTNAPSTSYDATATVVYTCADGFVLVVHTCKSPQDGAVVDPTDLFTTIKDFITTKVLPASAILFVIGVTIRVAFSRVKKYAK